MWHLHLKINNQCNANCSFCIESGSEGSCNDDDYLYRLNEVLSEMEKNGILHSVSITGGEPLLSNNFENIIKVIKKYPVNFLTLNTNGSLLSNNLELVNNAFDFINISRHHISDSYNNSIFGTKMPTLSELKNIKAQLTHSKLRLQYVITHKMDYSAFISILQAFSFADDLSFRSLMTQGDIHNVKYDNFDSITTYFSLLNIAYNEFDFVEQVIQDYYVYEIWNHLGKNINFSYSDMGFLLETEAKEDVRVCREFVLHPNGALGGSWDSSQKSLLGKV